MLRECVLPETGRTAETHQPRKYRVVFFPDGSKVGVTGLNSIFEDACMQGKSPDRLAAKYLVSRLSEKNYIPQGCVQDYEYKCS